MSRFVGLDPATSTGIVALDTEGNVLLAKVLSGSGATTARKIRMLHDEVFRHLKPDDEVCIEGFAMDAHDINKVSSGNNWAARLATDRKVGSFVVAEPSLLKKFVNVSEWIGVKGNKTRLKGPEVKKLVMAAVEVHWGYSAISNDISDAYVLARIAEAVHVVRNGKDIQDYLPYQREVIETILDPVSKKKKAKDKKAAKAIAKINKTKPPIQQASLF